MSFQQSAGFRIAGRIATRRKLQQATQIGLSVARREPDPTSPQGWRVGRTDHFVLNIHEPAMQAYVDTLTVNDLVVAEGEMVTTQYTPDGAARPINGTRLQVTFLAAVPRDYADRIDHEALPANLPKADRPPF